MRTIRIFQPGPFEQGQTIALSSDASHHVAVVLRMQLGDRLTLFCGDHHEYSSIITEIRKKSVIVNILSQQYANRESPRAIHLAQGISKGDRMEWVIQKAVELGVTGITPLMTEYCAVRLDDARLLKKQQQWQSIAISACEQSGRNYVPMISKAIQLDRYIQDCHSTFKLMLHPRATKTLRTVQFSAGDMTLLIGPEGGLSDDEVAQSEQSGFKALALGPRILRTETAAIAALSVLQALTGDL